MTTKRKPYQPTQYLNHPPTYSRSSIHESVISNSYSQVGSTRHMLAGMHQQNNSGSDYGGLLVAPNAPFVQGSRDNLSARSSNLSLSVNYLPSKFSSSIMSPSGARFRTRKTKGPDGDVPNLPKRGGGLEAFGGNEARMPHGKKQLRWNRFKWTLFLTNTLLTTYALAALVVCLLIWFDVWEHADVIRVGNRSELIISTIAASVGVFTALIGWAGILLNNRGFLAWYTFLTWITFAFLVTPGYVTYRRRTFNLEGKINAQWSRDLGPEGRLRVQNKLLCCGYFSPFVEATISQTCYARSILEGCKGPYLDFEKFILKRWFAASFILVPIHIASMLAGLLCSNHITYRYGKGMMPEAYRLNMSTMAVIMENYANQLADQYGADIADDLLKRSGAVSPSGGGTGYGPLGSADLLKSPTHVKSTSVGSHGPDDAI